MQIIPLELMAAAGLLFTFRQCFQGKDVIFSIDNQSVCGALTKGSSKSKDIQHLSTAFHAMCASIGCRIWIEWVPSISNPADILSRDHRSEESVLQDQKDFHFIGKILEAVIDSLSASPTPGESR